MLRRQRGVRLASPAKRGRRHQLFYSPHIEHLEPRQMMATDVILEWNDILLQANANDHARVAPQQGGPVLTARAFAIVSAAMYDAYNSIERIGESYLVKVPHSQRADVDAAVAQAAHDTLVALFPAQKASFDAELKDTLARIPNGAGEGRGRAVGTFVARKILAERASDGAAAIGTPTYEPNGLPGFHDKDPLHSGQGYYGPGAGNIEPFAMDDVTHFAARALDDGTPDKRLEFLQSPEYTEAYHEVLALGSDGISAPTSRTEEQTIVGRYWAYDGRPGLGTPPRLYNQIVREIAIQEGNTEGENARLFALVNIAMADAGVASWLTKYDSAFWRPVMGVRGADMDGNAETISDADWTPLGAPASNPRAGESDFTPPFPSYTSGHATFGAAAFQILERFYGRDDISFSFVSDEFNGTTIGSDGQVRPWIERSFASFTDAKIENAESRIYLGIHWRFDADEGIRQGDAIADYVFENVLTVSQPNQSSTDSVKHHFAPPDARLGQRLFQAASAGDSDGTSVTGGRDRRASGELGNPPIARRSDVLLQNLDFEFPRDRSASRHRDVLFADVQHWSAASSSIATAIDQLLAANASRVDRIRRS